ncbi:MAG: hypothetical protein JNM75_08555 [Rhodospirillales bacterium]|nr:hypothetical protein [Rhodospirillales bacterium]
MNARPDRPYCLVTITDDEFSIATEVLLYSFLKHNSWFAGDLIVIEDGLSTSARARIEALGAVRFAKPDLRLQRQTQALCSRAPELATVYKRFYSFETFRLGDYRRVVYLDSDIYCAGSIEPLFLSSEPLLACPDGFTYGDRIRASLAGTEAGPPTPQSRYGHPFSASFNAGVLSVGPPLLGEEQYLALLDMLDFDTWRALGPSKFTDQMILNVVFEDRFCPLAAIYNYMIFIEEYQKICEGVAAADARLVHFAGPIKPWNEYDPIALLQRAPQFARFIDAWRELLHEARNTRPPAALSAAYRRQKAWIEAFNRAPLTPTGRLY